MLLSLLVLLCGAVLSLLIFPFGGAVFLLLSGDVAIFSLSVGGAAVGGPSSNPSLVWWFSCLVGTGLSSLPVEVLIACSSFFQVVLLLSPVLLGLLLLWVVWLSPPSFCCAVLTSSVSLGCVVVFFFSEFENK